MSSDIRVNEPGAGEWIMEQSEGHFRPDMDRSIAHYSSAGELLGGFVYCQYMGRSIAVHNAGKGPGWCTRELLWMAFHYPFVQLNCKKLLAPVASNNYRALAINLRAGFRLEAVIPNAFDRDVHLMVLGMEPSNCRWLQAITPKHYRSGKSFDGR